MPADDVHAFAVAWQHGELWHVPGAAHLAAYKSDPARYSEKVVSFLARAFANAVNRAPSCA